MADKKKAVPLRISEKLYIDLAAWAEDDFRSLNGQIEYLLTECVRQRRKTGGYVGKDIDKPLEIDLGDTKNKKE
ncbi:MAG: PTS ascorbate transporter subunit IIC [Oscillospiraceae bacterium]|nr:PTS ascorbate transporter subunit IIC [Oscillospiraceae bacterium]